MFASPSLSSPPARSPRSSRGRARLADHSPERALDLLVHHKQHGGDEPWRWLGRAKRASSTGRNLTELEVGEVGSIKLHARAALPANYRGVSTSARVQLLPRGTGAGARPLSESEVVFGEWQAASVPISFGPVYGAGDFLLAVTLEGGHIGGSPFALRVHAGRAHAPSCELIGNEDDGDNCPLVSSAHAGRRTFFPAVLRDKFGNLLGSGGDRVAVRFDVRVATLPSGVDPSSARVACDVLDNGDGTYTVAYIADVAASYDATVTLDGMTIGASAMHCLVLPGATVPSAATLELGLTSTRATIAGAPATFTITSRDAHGNPRGMGGDAWRVELRRVGVPADIVPARVRDNGDGTYSVVAMPKRKGTYTVVVSGSDGREVRSPAVELKVAAAPVAGSSSRALGNILDGLTDLVAGEPSLLFVEPCDALGNAHDEVAEVLGALRVELTDGSGRPDHESRAFARTQGQHIAVEVVAAVAGAALLHVAISGVPVRGSPFGVRVRPGEPDASKKKCEALAANSGVLFKLCRRR
ncbi:hypothetical protein T492DRAFT_491179 [Pavlovales sp. CCMP2436]|nr:hypothetical protein T492DRAFT_491179 [Pavlovales sp. CCMP2436]